MTSNGDIELSVVSWALSKPLFIVYFPPFWTYDHHEMDVKNNARYISVKKTIIIELCDHRFKYCE